MTQPPKFGEQTTYVGDSVLRLALDLKYPGERDQLKEVLSGDSGWEYCVLGQEDSVAMQARRSLQVGQVDNRLQLDLFTMLDDAASWGTELNNPDTHGLPSLKGSYLGLRLTGMSDDQVEAIKQQIRARFVTVKDDIL